jgi:hypothetical protein
VSVLLCRPEVPGSIRLSGVTRPAFDVPVSDSTKGFDEVTSFAISDVTSFAISDVISFAVSDVITFDASDVTSFATSEEPCRDSLGIRDWCLAD